MTDAVAGDRPTQEPRKGRSSARADDEEVVGPVRNVDEAGAGFAGGDAYSDGDGVGVAADR